MTAFFKYGEDAVIFLKKKDKIMKKLIENYGFLERAIYPDLFACLSRSIIAQQISTKAAKTVVKRFDNLLGGVSSPQKTLAIEDEALRSIGLSGRKIAYIKGVAEKTVSGELDKASLSALSDEDLIKKLASLNGVGVWTAEMTLIFCFERLDVFSWGDLVVRNNLVKLYGLPSLDRKSFDLYKKRFSPYGSVASFYLWKYADNEW